LKRFIYIFFLFSFALAFAQKPVKSIIQEQKAYYDLFKCANEVEFDSVQLILGNRSDNSFMRAESSNTCTLNKKVFGWHPYWSGSVYTNYQWSLLSDLCYFDYSINPATGSNTNTAFAWNTASVVTVAKNNGTKIHICATLFSSHASFWASTTSQNNFINNIISLLNARQGNGVNIDFEGMGGSDKVPFTNFITNLNTALNAANPNYQLSVCLYAVDWGAVFDMAALNSQVDFFTIMGYDYYYSASAQAGPTSPLYNFQTSYNYTLPKSISYYMKQGASANKLVLGLPYYGREWEVSSTTVPASTTNGFNSSRTLSYINNNPATYSSSVKFWENNCYSPYYKFLVGSSNRQCFIDDVYSLGRKYDLVNQRGLAGIGIWALGYDDGMTSYWNLIKDKFSNCAPLVCNDSIYDMGGPTRNYYDNEKYDFVLNAGVGQNVKLQFVSFGTELNYDTLWIYNGTSTLSPLMGSYTGTNSPGTILSSGQFLTLRFKSDGNTVSFGYKAYKSCYTPTVSTSLTESNFNDELIVLPNPASDEVFIRSNKSIKEINVFDVDGKCIKHQLTESKSENKIILSELTRGIYFLEIKDELGYRETKKILVQ
jgi:spore germination protein YaaH